MNYVRGSTLPWMLGLLFLTCLAYLPGLDGGWLFDDYSNIVRQDSVHAESIDAALLGRVIDGFGNAAGRPLAMATFAVDHAIWGQRVFGYKLTSLIVHLFNALLVFLLARRLLALAWTERASNAAAFAVAAIWSLHPLQVSTVHYVVQRMEMLSLTFVVLALLAYLHGRTRQIAGGRGWPWLAGSALLTALGLLCKETAALAPAYALVLELTLLGFAASDPRTGRRWKLVYAIAVVGAVIVFAALVVPKYAAPEVYAIRDYDALDRVLTQLRVLPMYLGWIVLPQPGQYVFYYDSFEASRGLLDPWTTLAGGIVVAALIGLAWWLRRRAPLTSLGLLWFFAAHVLTSNVVPLELVFEHRNHFALLGIALVAADLFLRLPASEIPRIRPFAVGVVVVGLFGLTLIRSATWGHPLNLALALTDKNPTSARASMDLGEQFMLRAAGDASSRYYAMAEKEFERGSRVPNASPMPEQGLIVLAALAGQPAKPEWWDRIVAKLQSRAIGPQELGMVTGFLKFRREGLEFDDERFADVYVVVANRLEMPPSQYYAFAEHALEYAKDVPLAKDLFRLAVDRSADDPDFVVAMIDAQLKAGHRDMARAMADHAQARGIADITVPAESAAPAAEPRP